MQRAPSPHASGVPAQLPALQLSFSVQATTYSQRTLLGANVKPSGFAAVSHTSHGLTGLAAPSAWQMPSTRQPAHVAEHSPDCASHVSLPGHASPSLSQAGGGSGSVPVATVGWRSSTEQ